MAACMRHVHKHNLSPAARQSRGRTSPRPEAEPASRRAGARAGAHPGPEDRRENYRRERVREARALRRSRRRSAPAEARRMCDDSFHIIMSPRTSAYAGGTTRPRTRVTPLALPLARAVTPIERRHASIATLISSFTSRQRCPSRRPCPSLASRVPSGSAPLPRHRPAQ